MSTEKTWVGVLGVGLMGEAIILRLLECGYSVVVWNRTMSKTEQVRLAGAQVEETVESFMTTLEQKTKPPHFPIVISFVNNYSAFEQLFFEGAEKAKLLEGKLLLSLCSSTPEVSRQFDKKLREKVNKIIFLDGCYGGSPLLVRSGRGQIIISSPDMNLSSTITEPTTDIEKREELVRRLCSSVGELIYTGTTVGSNKAFDFALVDTYMMNLISFYSGIAYLRKESIPPELFLHHLKRKLTAIPDSFEKVIEKISRAEKLSPEDPNYNQQYTENVTASIETWYNFFHQREDYSSDLNNEQRKYVEGLLTHPAVAGDGRKHFQQDISRLQELLIFNRDHTPGSSGPSEKITQ